MAIGHTIINGASKVWLARVAFKGRRRAKVCRTRGEAATPLRTHRSSPACPRARGARHHARSR
jgi:hypothetical protein